METEKKEYNWDKTKLHIYIYIYIHIYIKESETFALKILEWIFIIIKKKLLQDLNSFENDFRKVKGIV